MIDPIKIENLPAGERPEELTAEEAEAAQGGRENDGNHRMICYGEFDRDPCYRDPFGDDWEQVMMDIWGMQ